MNDKTVVLNGNVINYDGNVDYHTIASEVVIYDESHESCIIERVQGCRIVVTKEMALKRDIIMAFPDSVELICEAGTGYNNIDLQAAKEKGIQVCNIPSYSSERVAHTVIMMVLNLASSMQKQIRMLERNDHTNFHEHLMVSHVEVNGKTLGIIGYGNIAKAVIVVAKALGMNVIVYTRTPRADEDGVHFASLEEVLKQSDYVSLHCPLNEQTKHLLNKQTIALMKASAYIINTARGALINEQDLIEALSKKVIAGAGLDVQEVEPLADSSPLYQMENVILTPHIGWRGLETRQRLVSMVKDNISAFVKGAPIHLVEL